MIVTKIWKVNKSKVVTITELANALGLGFGDKVKVVIAPYTKDDEEREAKERKELFKKFKLEEIDMDVFTEEEKKRFLKK